MRIARALLMLVLLIASTTPVQTQTATDVNEGLLLTPDAWQDGFTLSWWGRAGKTYFIQQSDDLVQWTYLPVIESGHDAVLSYGLSSSAHWNFFRLRIADEASSTPPADVDAIAMSTDSVQVTWTPGDATQATTLEISTDFGYTWQTLGVAAVGATTATITGLPTDHTMYVRARTGGTVTNTAAAPTFDAPAAAPPNGAPVSAPSDSASATLSSEPLLLTKKIEAEGYRWGFPGFNDASTVFRTYQHRAVQKHNGSTTSDVTYTDVMDITSGISNVTPQGGWQSSYPYSSGWNVTSNIARQRTDTLSGIGNTETDTEALSNEYTKAQLITNVQSWLPAYPSKFTPAGPNSNGAELAYAQIINPTEGWHYLVQKLTYKWAVTKKPNQVLNWLEVFTPDGGAPIVTPMSWTNDGSHSETDEYVIDPTTRNSDQGGIYSVLRIDFKLRNEADVEKGWDNTGTEPWTSVGVGKTNTIIKCMGATSDFELVVAPGSEGKLSISSPDITGVNTPFDITGLADSNGLGSTGAQIILRQKGTTTVLKTLHVHVLPERNIHFTVFHASDEGPGRVPDSALPANLPTPEAIASELNATFWDQANIYYIANLTNNPVVISNCDGAFATDGVCYYDQFATDHNFKAITHISNVAVAKATELGINLKYRFIIQVKELKKIGGDVEGITEAQGATTSLVESMTVMQTYSHETGHSLNITKQESADGQHHDLGKDPNGQKPLMHRSGTGHWIRQEDWREANDHAGRTYQ